MTPILQPALAPAFLIYLMTDYWPLCVIMVLSLIPMWRWIKHRALGRLDTRPRFQRRFLKFKSVLALKTLAFYTYKILIPQKEFMYQTFVQSYGTDIRETRKALKFDKWAYGGLFILALLIYCLFIPSLNVGAWWYLIFCLPYLNLITWHQHNNTRYAVLPSIGLFYVVSYYLPLWAVMIWAVLFYVKFVMSMRQYTCGTELMQHHFDDNPDAIGPYVASTRHFIQQGDRQQALHIVSVGLSKHPESYGLWHLYCACGPSNWRDAVKKMEELLPYQTFKAKKDIRNGLEKMKCKLRKMK
jgi:hypothetical protein